MGYFENRFKNKFMKHFKRVLTSGIDVYETEKENYWFEIIFFDKSRALIFLDVENKELKIDVLEWIDLKINHFGTTFFIKPESSIHED